MKYPVLKQFALGVWNVPARKFNENKTAELLFECKINTLCVNTEKDEIKTKHDFYFLRYNNDVQDFIYNNNAQNNTAEFFDDIANIYKDNIYYGEIFYYNPHPEKFTALKHIIKEYQKIYSDNIGIAITSTDLLEDINYTEQYTDLYLNIIKPKLYFFTMENWQNKAEIIPYYFDMARDKTYKKRLPFWYLLPQIKDTQDKRELLRWLVYTALAFGAKGIFYQNFFALKKGDKSSVTDFDGDKTALFEYIRNLNDEISEIGKLLAQCRCEGVICPDYNLCSKTLDVFYPILSLDGKNIICGCFTGKKGEKKALVTNIRHDIDTKAVMKLNGSVKIVNVFIGTTKFSLVPQKNKLDININRGDAVFIEFL